MLEGLINNVKGVPLEEFELNSFQIYRMAREDHKDLNDSIEKYKQNYNLQTLDVYVNLVLIHNKI